MSPVHCQSDYGHDGSSLKDISAIVVVGESDKFLHQIHSLIGTGANAGGLGTISSRHKLLLENRFKCACAETEGLQLAI